MPVVTGNTTGLKPSELKKLERIFRRRVDPHEVVGYELATFLAETSQEIGRQVGLLVTRRGEIEHVFVGDAHKLFLPDVGRLRGARGRFRGLRLVHTHLRGEPLTHDDLTDLALLRLDAVAAIGVTPRGTAGSVYVGHLLPPNADGDQFQQLPPQPAHALTVDFAELIKNLEDEFARTADRVAETDQGKDKAILVHVVTGRKDEDAEARMAELGELARTARVRVLDVVTQHRPATDPKFLVGRGKLEEIVLKAMQLGAEALIFDPDLTPAQARAVSDFTDLKVLDRTMLILDIFAQRAQSADGKLQVELAQLKYTLPRLVEKNTMMSRLTGGIGGRGPGETKLEINRRRARERITRLEKEIELVSRRRQVRRARRNRREVPIVSIVGYTNAGKSSLLNALTEGDVYAANELFATLDPTSRRLRFPQEREVILTDTVGFIRDLPPDLVRAFRATLEELDDADLLLHIVDIADPQYEQHMRSVEGILGELGLAEKPRVVVFNKVDLVDPGDAARVAAAHRGVAISAQATTSLGPLLARMQEELWKETGVQDLVHVPGGEPVRV